MTLPVNKPKFSPEVPIFSGFYWYIKDGELGVAELELRPDSVQIHATRNNITPNDLILKTVFWGPSMCPLSIPNHLMGS